MASSPLLSFLIFCVVGWILIVFSARLLALVLSRVLGTYVGFHIAGCNCLRDVSFKFKKGSVESISVGEIKLTLRKSLTKLGFSFVSREPKLQLIICDLEVVVRPSERSMKKSKPSKPKKSHSAGRARWMLLTNIARLLSVSVTELVLKVPKAAIGIKDLRVDISRTCEPNPILNVKLYIIHLLVQLSNSQLSFDHSSFEQGACLLTGQNYAVTTEKESAAFICEDFSVACELGYDSDQGIKIKNLDFASGDITINLNENLSLGTKKKSEVSSGADAKERCTDITAAKKSQDNKLSSILRKHIIPDKFQLAEARCEIYAPRTTAVS